VTGRSGLNERETVLDASVGLPFLHEESGADRVERALQTGAIISALNWAEVLTKLIAEGGDPREVGATALPGGPGGPLRVVSFDESQAREAARLTRHTPSHGLSLAERAALGLALSRRLRVLTADRAWKSLRLPVTIEVIR